MRIEIDKSDLAYVIEYAEAGIALKRGDKTDGCGEEAMRLILGDLKKKLEEHDQRHSQP